MEGFVLKKSEYGEADLIVTFFTREKGKTRALARQAKKSRKRFGGRLELFNHLKLSITFNENKFNIVNEVNIIKSFSGVMNNLETFMTAIFILEHAEILTTENEPNELLFLSIKEALISVQRNERLLQNLLSFQLAALSASGYEPVIESSQDREFVYLDISKGKSVSGKPGNGKKNIYKLFTDIINIPEKMDIFLGKVLNNIKVLTKYIEYHTEKKFKTSKFLEDMNL